MTAPDLSRMGGQPKAPCPNCRRDNAWFQPDCRHCGLNLWTNDFTPLDEYFARRFGGTLDEAEASSG